MGARFLFRIFHPIDGVQDYTCNFELIHIHYSIKVT